MSRAALFLDKDGTLLIDVPYSVDPDKMMLADSAQDALLLFGRLDMPMFIVSNQSGVALGKFPIDALSAVESRLDQLAIENGASLSGFYWCPHLATGKIKPYNVACDCRKPKPGMLLRAAMEHDIDLANSWFIGDILDDVEAGNRAGCQTVLIDNGNETEWKKGPFREPDFIASTLLDAALEIRSRTWASVQ
jgi:D-glycero-D-manno-heptose 1,7-bisphosphate phosphatase